MNIQEKITFFKGEERRLTKKAQQYAKEGFIGSARATMGLVTGVKATLSGLEKKLITYENTQTQRARQRDHL
jgi:hypothetical protein